MLTVDLDVVRVVATLARCKHQVQCSVLVVVAHIDKLLHRLDLQTTPRLGCLAMRVQHVQIKHRRVAGTPHLCGVGQ
jgi:hypothetical protein